MRLLLIFATFFLFSCSGPSEESVKESLDGILKSDLSDIIVDVDSSLLVSTPHFTIESFKFYEKSRYSYKAVVYFYFLADESFLIERKFRFNHELSKWERYYNEYQRIKN